MRKWRWIPILAAVLFCPALPVSAEDNGRATHFLRELAAQTASVIAGLGLPVLIAILGGLVLVLSLIALAVCRYRLRHPGHRR